MAVPEKESRSKVSKPAKKSTPTKPEKLSKPPVKAAAKSGVSKPATAKARVRPKRELTKAEKMEAAVEELKELEERKRQEEELQAEIRREMERDRTTGSFVKDDCSPANTGRESLIIEFAPLIKYIAQRIAARLPANIELDDLISSGVIGLMDAIDKYDSSRDNKFKTYAEFRIRGAILDELRAQDWVPRSVREKAKMLERAYAKIEQDKGRQASDDEICSELNLSKEEFHDLLNQVRSVSILSFDDLTSFSKADKKSLQNMMDGSPRVANPFSEVNLASLKRMIAEAIKELPEKQRLVLSLYYYEDLNLKEIGKVLDVTESRVSQLHTQAVLRLKGKLRNHWDEFLALMS